MPPTASDARAAISFPNPTWTDMPSRRRGIGAVLLTARASNHCIRQVLESTRGDGLPFIASTEAQRIKGKTSSHEGFRAVPIGQNAASLSVPVDFDAVDRIGVPH
jgi:hypothetical protein